MRVRGVLFDVDDTLFDHAAAEEAGLLGQLRDQGLLGRFPDLATAVALWHGIMQTQFDRSLRGELTYTEQRRARVREFLSHLGDHDVPDERADAWFANYDAHCGTMWAAFPDAAPAVRSLAAVYRLGIVSNAAADLQRRKLDATGLLPYFETGPESRLTCADSHGATNPATSIFLAGCATLGLAPAEVAYVGDDYVTDAEGADDAGLHACWLDRHDEGNTRQVRPTVQVIHSLNELPAALG
jgi:putative hydrolase of the HAD superfamily